MSAPGPWDAGSAPAPGRPPAASAAPRARPAAPAATPCVQARRAARAEGAGDSGLSRLIEMHAFNAAGDAAVAISLAGTLFFQVPTGEARGQVALFLGLTMLPFAIVAPLIGPFLDRFSHGRRWAIGATMAIRAFLCWVLATAVRTDSTWLFPAALGVLVASKAYGVTRAAAVPRLVPRDLDPGQGQRPDLAGRRRRRGGLGADRGPGVAVRVRVVPALRLRAVRGRDGPGDPAARAGRLQRTARSAGCCPGPESRPRTRPPTGPDPRRGRVRPARQLRPALAVGVPHHVHGVPAAGEPDRRLEPAGAARRSSSAPPASATPSASPRARCCGGSTPRSRWCSRCWPTPRSWCFAALFYGVVPLALLGLTAGLAQSLAKLLARLHHPARRPRAGPGQRVRPLGHHPPAGVGASAASSASRCR